MNETAGPWSLALRCLNHSGSVKDMPLCMRKDLLLAGSVMTVTRMGTAKVQFLDTVVRVQFLNTLFSSIFFFF